MTTLSCHHISPGELDRRQVQLVQDRAECSPRCTLCAPVRRMTGDGPISMLKFDSFRSSIERALLMCPTGALTLAVL